MADYEAARYIESVSEFPGNATGSFVKPALRACAARRLTG